MILFSLIAISMCSKTVQALNYTPGLQVGDDLIYEVSSQWDTRKVKHTITDINDSATGTWVNGTVDNVIINKPLGYLTNYSLYPQHLVTSILAYTTSNSYEGLSTTYYIIPGTILVKFSEEITEYINSTFGVSVSCSSIDKGLGIVITRPNINWIRIFNEQGILERETYLKHTAKSVEETYIKLKSINGKPYRSIPEYPVYLIITFSIVGMGIIFIFNKKKLRFFSSHR